MARLWQHKKTVELLRQSFAIGENHLIVSAFFFDRRRPHGKAPEDMLRSLLFQVFSAQPDLILTSLPRDVQHYRGEPLTDWLAAWDNIRDVFEKAVSASNETTFCFFIDALDESEAAATGRRGSNNLGAYDVLIDFVRSCERHTNIKLCISSRTLPQFSFRFREIPRVAVQDYNREDIEIYVKHRLSDVTALEDDVVEDLVNAVVKGSEGVMLWAVMVVEQLLRGIEVGASNSDLWKQLRSVPRSLADLYKRMMAEIPRKHRRESARIFRLVVTAPGPLDLELLDLAAEDYIEGSSAGRKSNLRAANAVIGERSPRSEDPSAFQVRMKRRISNLCVDFLTVHDDGQVQFIHSTAKMFVSEHLEEFSPQDDDPGFDAPVNLLSGTIMRLKEALQPFFRGGRVLSFPRGLEKEQSTVARYVQEAVVAAVCADAQAKDENSYLRLVDELGTTCFQVRSLRDPRNTAAAGGSKPVRRRFQGLSQEHYSSLLAIKAGLWKYVASTTDDVTVELKDESGRSLLWYALNRQELRHLPWGDVTPVSPEDRDLPDPKVVRDLLSLGSHANESGLWQKVLEAGYHCFATDIVPDHPGPEQTAENGEKWVSITTYFLEHGADASIAFMTRFRNRFIEAASPPDFPEASSANEPFEKEITPRTTLNETIRVQRLYHEQYRRMLAMVKERAGPGLSDSDRHGHGPWSSGDMYLHPGLPLVATPMELPADGSSTPPLWLEKPEPRPMPPHSPPPHDPTAMLPPPADRAGRSSLRLSSFPFRRSKGKDKHKGKDKGNGDGDEHPSTSSPEPTPKLYSVAERALLVRPHFRKTSSSASASGEQSRRA
ncbi:hypothetical protein BR93DRAFT_830464 [Coniochaeta sp. PMI_546]|nr:hypothetical protein BR93DRAFT_830464 [Coniochaeta sp. PMI_546]